jgi:hypothetical protein
VEHVAGVEDYQVALATFHAVPTLARHAHHPAARCASDRGQPASARGVQSVRAPLATKIARRGTATWQARPSYVTFALIAAQQIVSYFILIKVISGRRRARPNATWQTGVEFRIMPSDDEGHWYWEVIKDGHEVVARAALLTRSPLHANRQTKRREKQS